ncbi:MAG: iron-containing redox enzyme family protein [Thaumarchaeota archaeon]|nr:iron-containing redox enzyme family protein [Nitrososphaerota archaeon]MBI3640957.1 iron-containing redox enzyme family protein [Nitrososphaerota archaeon]
MNSLVTRIDELIEKQSLLKHQFYVMWNEGTLTLESLSGYSKEYFQLVKAVPAFVNMVMENASHGKDTIAVNQKEEFEHIAPWMKFADSLGVSQSELEEYVGLEKTRQAVSNLSKLMTTFEGGAAAMYALEQEIPKISLSKIDGLRKFYNITTDDAIEYFRLHTEADIRHAALWRKILEKTPIKNEEELFNIASKSIAAQNMLLDSCYEAYC